MHQYDLNIILNPSLSEAQLQTEKDVIGTQLERVQAELVGTDEWGMKRLAYPIEKHAEGYYIIYKLNMTPDAPKALETNLRLRDNVMRALVVRERPDWKTRQARKPEGDEAAAS